MKTPPKDAILDYVLLPKNLPAALDIVKRANEIRRTALENFWDILKAHLERTKPRGSKYGKMRWSFWSKDNRPDASRRNLYYWEAAFDGKQSLGYVLDHELRQSSFEFFFNIAWGDPVTTKSPLLRLREVQKLRELINSEHQKESGWWFSRARLFNEDSAEDFLKRFAQNEKRMLDQITQSFWPLVEDTFDTIAEANRAIQKTLSK